MQWPDCMLEVHLDYGSEELLDGALGQVLGVQPLRYDTSCSKWKANCFRNQNVSCTCLCFYIHILI